MQSQAQFEQAMMDHTDIVVNALITSVYLTARGADLDNCHPCAIRALCNVCPFHSASKPNQMHSSSNFSLFNWSTILKVWQGTNIERHLLACFCLSRRLDISSSSVHSDLCADLGWTQLSVVCSKTCFCQSMLRVLQQQSWSSMIFRLIQTIFWLCPDCFLVS